jgi:nucleoside-diphosphate-sugar epimerase
MKKILITGGSGFIGTHLINELEKLHVPILNIDINPPILENHLKYWRECDILDRDQLQQIMIEFQPIWCVHLAADGSVSGKSLDDYEENTVGTQNLLECIKNINSIKKVIITSSQVVCKLGHIPLNDLDFSPEYAYAESKVLTEKYTREANLKCCWTIIRPTYIWGPYHPRNSKDLFYSIKKRWYLFPGKSPIIRSYGYVKNVAKQIVMILEIQDYLVDKKVLYVGDKPINYFEWVNLFSLNLTGKRVRIVPRKILYLVALIGEGIGKITSKAFLMNMYRYRNMTMNNWTPMDKTFELLGYFEDNLENNIEETTRWLNMDNHS